MDVMVQAHYLIDLGMWEKYCRMTGTNLYAISEGLMDLNHVITITEKQAKKLGVIK